MAKNLSKTTYCILFCNGGSCVKNGAEEITKEVRAHLRMEGLYHSTHTIKTLCMGRCADGPNLLIMPEGVWYKELNIEKGIDIVEKHIKANRIVNEYLLYKPGMDSVQSKHESLTVSKKAFRIVSDAELRTILLANADAWEMNLYPLLKAIFTKFHASAEIHLPGRPGQVYLMEHPALLRYQGQYAKLSDPSFSLDLLIGIPAKSDPYEVQNERICFIDVFKQMNAPFKHGIRLRDKTGKTKLTVLDNSEDLSLWEHIVKIYLDKEAGEVKTIKETRLEFLNIE